MAGNNDIIVWKVISVRKKNHNFRENPVFKNHFKMEQLAHFVTKSFEYNNNRVIDVLNMATKSLICDNIKSSDSSGALSNTDDTDIDDDADTVDIDITDMSSNDSTDYNVNRENDSHNVVKFVKDSNIALIKKYTKVNFEKSTKNWLVPESLKKKLSAG